jgi:hypothetical protein
MNREATAVCYACRAHVPSAWNLAGRGFIANESDRKSRLVSFCRPCLDVVMGHFKLRRGQAVDLSAIFPKHFHPGHHFLSAKEAARRHP